MQSTKQIDIEVRNVYGNETIYILDHIFSLKHRALTGKKTISQNDINVYRTLGVKFRVVTKQV